MRQPVALLSLGALLFLGQGSSAQDHLVASDTARQRVLEAEAARAQDLATVDRALSTPTAQKAAARLGADLPRVRAAAATLGADELRDLAARAAGLQMDPVAGMDQDIKLLLMIFLIVAIVILVLRAV